MVGSPVLMLTPYRTGMETQICWVSVMVQLVPQGSVSQQTVGVPWHATVTVPTDAVGCKITGAVTSTHCVVILLQPFPRLLSSPGQGRIASCS